MIVTVNLAKGAPRCRAEGHREAPERDPESSARWTSLCTDKTGTLTQDRIILERYLDIRGEESDRGASYAYLNSHFQTGLRNLLDVAVLAHADLHKILGSARAIASRRDPVRLLAPPPVGRGRAREDKHVLICKGAVEEIFAVCAQLPGRRDQRCRSTQATRGREATQTIALNADGFRVVAVAYREIDGPARRRIRSPTKAI